MIKLCDCTLHSNISSATIKDIEEVKNLLSSKLILKSYNLSFNNITPNIVCELTLNNVYIFYC